MKKCYLLLFAILCLGILSAWICHGQTNTIPTNPPPYPESTASDIAKVLQDFGVTNISVPSIGGLLALVYLAAKFIRNKTSVGNGALGQFLSSVVNLESAQKPALPPQPPQPIQPQPVNK